jgi:dCMP deaminase
MSDKVRNDGANRPDLNLYFMRMARLVATRSTCLRRAVGCVLVDEQGHVLSTGYNGVASGEKHCNQPNVIPMKTPEGKIVTRMIYPHACEGAMAPSGTELSSCSAVHAEQNALLQCPDVREIATAYVTVAPCDSCLKLFLNTGCRVLVIGDWYRNATGESNEIDVKKRWGQERLILVESRV